MVRALLDARGRRQRVVEVRFPCAFGRAMAGGDLLPGPRAALGTETYAEWLARQGR